MEKLTTRGEIVTNGITELVVKADLAENSGVEAWWSQRPYSYAIWEKIQSRMNKRAKKLVHQNTSLFVQSLFEAEEKNAEGFAKRMCCSNSLQT